MVFRCFLLQYNVLQNNLTRAIAEARRVENPRVVFHASDVTSMIQQLTLALGDAKEWCVDVESTKEGDILMEKLEVQLELLGDIFALSQAAPICSQELYIEFVHKLETTLEKAKKVNLERFHLLPAIDLIARSNIEYWLESMAARLRDVPIAKDCHEHDIKRLSQAILKAQTRKASEGLIEVANVLYEKLHTELGEF